MATGDVVSIIESHVQNEYMTIRPGVGVEWIIHNIYFNQPVEIQFYDGSNALIFEWINDIGEWPWTLFHLKNGYYLRVKATNFGTTLMAYDGVISA